MSKDNESPYLFQVWKKFKIKNDSIEELGHPENFKFQTEGEKPEKLGDGSFGVVYKVSQMDKDKLFAIKIFYNRNKDTPKEESVARKRFILEYTYITNIQKRFDHLKKLNSGSFESFSPDGVIEPYAATSQFKSSNAFKNLLSKEKNIQISDYAIILPLYDGTLKDLLEEEGKNNLSGYDILKGAEFDLRILSMIPILKTVVSGLKTLYIGDYRHLDVKPANIFYKTKGYNKFEFVLADMGYLNTKGKGTPNENTIIQDDNEIKYLLGTRHYRSPEQIDYFDKCDAKVEIDNTLKKATLIIRDPKFFDSIIQKDDILFFSKSEDRFTYVIEEVIAPSEKEQAVQVKFSLDSVKESLESEKDKTQVEFRKMQGIKTDLFSLGALAFDILTAGKSPERFYERIRNIDTKDRSNSIESIKNRYKRISAFKGYDTESQHIFELLKFNDKYPEIEIVDFIVKCMMYNSPGTYIEKFSAPNNSLHKVFDDINEDLDNLNNIITNRIEKSKALNVTYELLIKRDNQILTNKHVGSMTNRKLSDELDLIYDEGETNFFWRLVAGAKYLELLIKFLQEEIYNTGENYPFFIEIYPNNLSILRNEKRVIYNYVAFRDFGDYKKDISSDTVMNKLFTDFTHFFVPSEIAFIRRPVAIIPESGTKCRYDLLTDAASISEELKKDDWILQMGEDDNIVQVVYQIHSVDMDSKQIELKLGDSEVNNDTNSNHESESAPSPISLEKSFKGVVYRDLDRLKYYLNTLGNYVLHFFFANQGRRNLKTKPSIIRLMENNLYGDYEWKSKKESQSSQYIYEKLAVLYAKLILSNDPESYYQLKFKKKLDDYTIFSELMTEIDEIQKLISTVILKKDGGFIRDLPLEFIQSPDKLKLKLGNDQIDYITSSVPDEVNLNTILMGFLVKFKDPNKGIWKLLVKRIQEIFHK